jgi:hypothetical protein
VSASAGRIREGWRGAAGTAAHAHVARLREPLDAGRPAFVEADQVLADLASRLGAAKGALAAAVEGGMARGIEVDADGRAEPAARLTGLDWRAALADARRVQAAVDDARATAAAADERAAAHLRVLAAQAADGWATVPPTDPPSRGDPRSVNAWWSSLTDPQRRWLITHRPDLVGHLDGIPIAARDQANRLLLDAQRADLREQRALTARAELPAPAKALEVKRLDRLLAGLDLVEARLTGHDQPQRAYLLGLDPAGDGRAVVAFGNPDTADNLVTLVPGMTSSLGGIDDELERTERMATRAAAIDPTQRTAAVLWLDYDAPDMLDDAARETRAREAGPALHRYAEGLRATHEGPSAHQAILGHSYGSVVVGVTARDHGLDADSLAFVGSPGVGVDGAADLGPPGGRTWSSTADDDLIAFAMSPHELAERLATGSAGLLTSRLFGPDTVDELWHGRDPSDPGFGARVFASDPRGHGGYWDTDNVALDNLARITLGPEHHGAVTRP